MVWHTIMDRKKDSFVDQVEFRFVYLTFHEDISVQNVPSFAMIVTGTADCQPSHIGQRPGFS